MRSDFSLKKKVSGVKTRRYANVVFIFNVKIIKSFCENLYLLKD